jgi:hypothetical protein
MEAAEVDSIAFESCNSTFPEPRSVGGCSAATKLPFHWILDNWAAKYRELSCVQIASLLLIGTRRA